ncbi:MAG: hypothetical protein IKA79_03085 [Lentisphaeria bacterium]|nr:hypothetical protein [Lentisphaeria bacterium]
MAEELTGATVTFGTDNYQDVIGIVQSESSKTTASIAEARNEEGKVIAMKAYSKSCEKTFEALFCTGTTPPEAGTPITVGTWKGIVTQSSVTKSNTDFTKISITATMKDSASFL